MTLRPLRCPQCSAPLTRDADGRDPRECPYCHAALAASSEGAPVIIVKREGTARPFTTGNVVAIIAVPALILGMMLLSRLTKEPEPTAAPVVQETPEPPPPPPAPKPPEPPSPVKELSRFGQAGSNPGQLNHANHLAIASDGSFFLGETASGRMQKFSPGGEYVDVVVMPPDRVAGQNGIVAMAADAKGFIYVNREGDVLVYDAATLKKVRELNSNYPTRYYRGGVAVEPSGNVVVMAELNGARAMLTLSSAGKVLGHEKTFANVVAVDGAGHRFLAGETDVEVRDAKGAVLSRVGVPGERVAYDGHGHLFVLTSSNTIEVLGLDGAKLVSLPVQADDLAFDPQGHLVTTDGAQVTTWAVTLP